MRGKRPPTAVIARFIRATHFLPAMGGPHEAGHDGIFGSFVGELAP